MASSLPRPPLQIFQDPVTAPMAPVAPPVMVHASASNGLIFTPPTTSLTHPSPIKPARKIISPPKAIFTGHLNLLTMPLPMAPVFVTDSPPKRPTVSTFSTTHTNANGPPPPQALFTTFQSARPTNDKENVHAGGVYVPGVKGAAKRALSDAAPLRERQNKRARVVEEPVPVVIPEPADMPAVHDDGNKPAYSYAMLIGMAILRAPNRRLTLAQIYKWIADTFEYYRSIETGWQNSIRHNLSLNKAFVKQERPKGDPGKGNYWAIAPGCEAHFLKEKQGRRPLPLLGHPPPASMMMSATPMAMTSATMTPSLPVPGPLLPQPVLAPEASTMSAASLAQMAQMAQMAMMDPTTSMASMSMVPPPQQQLPPVPTSRPTSKKGRTTAKTAATVTAPPTQLPTQNQTQTRARNDISSDATISAPSEGPTRETEFEREHAPAVGIADPTPATRAMRSSPPPVPSSPPAPIRRPRPQTQSQPQPRPRSRRAHTPPVTRRLAPPSSWSRKRKFAAAMDDSGYFSTMVSSIPRPYGMAALLPPPTTRMTTEAELDRPRTRSGRAEDELDRMCWSSHDSPRTLRTVMGPPMPDANSSSPLHHVAKRRRLPPPTPRPVPVFPVPTQSLAMNASPKTALRLHREKMRALVGSPSKPLGEEDPAAPPYSPAFRLESELHRHEMDEHPYVDPLVTDMNIFLDSPCRPQGRGIIPSPEKRSITQPPLERARASANVLADITGNGQPAVTLAASPVPKFPFLRSPIRISSPRKSPVVRRPSAVPAQENWGVGGNLLWDGPAGDDDPDLLSGLADNGSPVKKTSTARNLFGSTMHGGHGATSRF